MHRVRIGAFSFFLGQGIFVAGLNFVTFSRGLQCARYAHISGCLCLSLDIVFCVLCVCVHEY